MTIFGIFFEFLPYQFEYETLSFCVNVFRTVLLALRKTYELMSIYNFNLFYAFKNF